MGIYEEMPLNFDLKRMWKEGVWAIGHEFGHNVQWMTGRSDKGYFFGKSAVTVFFTNLGLSGSIILMTAI